MCRDGANSARCLSCCSTILLNRRCTTSAGLRSLDSSSYRELITCGVAKCSTTFCQSTTNKRAALPARAAVRDSSDSQKGPHTQPQLREGFSTPFLREWSRRSVLNTSTSTFPPRLRRATTQTSFGQAPKARERWISLGSVRCYYRTFMVRWGSGFMCSPAGDPV